MVSKPQPPIGTFLSEIEPVGKVLALLITLAGYLVRYSRVIWSLYGEMKSCPECRHCYQYRHLLQNERFACEYHKRAIWWLVRTGERPPMPRTRYCTWRTFSETVHWRLGDHRPPERIPLADPVRPPESDPSRSRSRSRSQRVHNDAE